MTRSLTSWKASRSEVATTHRPGPPGRRGRQEVVGLVAGGLRDREPERLDERRQARRAARRSSPRTRGPSGTRAAPRCGRSATSSVSQATSTDDGLLGLPQPEQEVAEADERVRRAAARAADRFRQRVVGAMGERIAVDRQQQTRRRRTCHRRTSIAYPDGTAIVAHREMAEAKGSAGRTPRDRRVAREGEDDRGLPRQGLHGRIVDRPRPRPAAQRGRGSGRAEAGAVGAPRRRRRPRLRAALRRRPEEEIGRHRTCAASSPRPTSCCSRQTKTAKARRSPGISSRC